MPALARPSVGVKPPVEVSSPASTLTAVTGATPLLAAVTRWAGDRCDSEDVRLLNEALAAKWLPNESTNAALAPLVVVTQTLVELLVMVAAVRLVPWMIPLRERRPRAGRA